MNMLKIEIISKGEFVNLLSDQLVKDKEDLTKKEIIDDLLEGGFPKLDFDNLDKFLSQIFISLDNIAVDFGDSMFVWVVSGNRAILVRK